LRHVSDRPALDLAVLDAAADPLEDHAGAKQLAGTAAYRADELVGLALLVGEHAQVGGVPAAVVRRMPRRCLADQDDGRACVLDLLPGAIHLNRVVAAMDS